MAPFVRRMDRLQAWLSRRGLRLAAETAWVPRKWLRAARGMGANPSVLQQILDEFGTDPTRTRVAVTLTDAADLEALQELGKNLQEWGFIAGAEVILSPQVRICWHLSKRGRSFFREYLLEAWAIDVLSRVLRDEEVSTQHRRLRISTDQGQTVRIPVFGLLKEVPLAIHPLKFYRTRSSAVERVLRAGCAAEVLHLAPRQNVLLSGCPEQARDLTEQAGFAEAFTVCSPEDLQLHIRQATSGETGLIEPTQYNRSLGPRNAPRRLKGARGKALSRNCLSRRASFIVSGTAPPENELAGWLDEPEGSPVSHASVSPRKLLEAGPNAGAGERGPIGAAAGAEQGFEEKTDPARRPPEERSAATETEGVSESLRLWLKDRGFVYVGHRDLASVPPPLLEAARFMGERYAALPRFSVRKRKPGSRAPWWSRVTATATNEESLDVLRSLVKIVEPVCSSVQRVGSGERTLLYFGTEYGYYRFFSGEWLELFAYLVVRDLLEQSGQEAELFWELKIGKYPQIPRFEMDVFAFFGKGAVFIEAKVGKHRGAKPRKLAAKLRLLPECAILLSARPKGSLQRRLWVTRCRPERFRESVQDALSLVGSASSSLP